MNNNIEEDAKRSLPDNLFILPSNNPIPFPTMLTPVVIHQAKGIGMIEEVMNRNRLFGIMLIQPNETPADLSKEDFFNVGVVVKILKRLKMPDGSTHVIVHSLKRFGVKNFVSESPFFVAKVKYLDDIEETGEEMEALTRSVANHVKKLSGTHPFFTDEMRLAMANAPLNGVTADLIAFALALPKRDAQTLLETLSVKARFEKLLVHLAREQHVAELQKKIQDEVNTKLNKMQREFFLKEQLKAIRRELGTDTDESRPTLRDRLAIAQLPENVQLIAQEELDKFESIADHSPEHHIVRNYLELLLALPWNTRTEDVINWKNAEKILNEEHYGLEKVKERIIEFLAVRALKKESKGAIICLVGPPGVGKTSIGKSIAKTLGRKFFRCSLGGIRDEAEIRGHRRTYVGAMPGKIMQGLKRAGAKNAVIMLDEIDKLSHGIQSDPAGALLEVLDPEQNNSFLDHYLDVPFDLSEVLFITTANTTSTIIPALLDRMEIIELPGYTLEEKEHIARSYIIPKELDTCGLANKNIQFDKGVLIQILQDYAREPGLRSLQKQIHQIGRKCAAQLIKNPRKRGVRIQAKDLLKYLGPKRFYNDMAERVQAPGIIVGLAWTAQGGDILFIEALDMPGTGNLKLTGQMGDVMTESAAIAWSYVKRRLILDGTHTLSFFKKRDIHMHIPAGAVPKDGPSAGITMATALFSLLTNTKARQKIAMTGELSLHGKVLPIGGLKEKLLAARRSGITTVIIPELNKKDLLDIPSYVLKDIKIMTVSHIDKVFPIALET